MRLRWPAGGLVKQWGYQQQAPFTTPDCSNVRPSDVIELRERGGRRPGLTKAYASRVSANLVQNLSSVAWIDSNGDRQLSLFGIVNGVPFTIVSGDISSLAGALLTEAGDELQTEDSQDILINDIAFKQTSKTLCAVERSQKIYVADWGDVVVTGTDGTITGNTLTAPSIGDWTSQGINIKRDVILISPRNSSGVETGTFEMTALGTSVSIDASLTNGACNYTIVPGLKLFTPEFETVGLLTSSNSNIPQNCHLATLYRDRLMLAGDFIWYASRQGALTDFDFSAADTDVQRAIAGNTADAGLIGEPLTALISHSDDYLVFGTENQLWVLRGDPAFGGQLDNLSYEVGILNAKSWCKLPDTSLLILSRHGVYRLAPGASSYPEPWSNDILPTDLVNVDSSSYISMGYDVQHRGVHLSITPAAGTGTHYWIDTDNRSFWPLTYGNGDHQPTAIYSFASASASPRRPLLGSRAGYVYYYDDTAANDDGTTITGYCVIGPFRLGDSFHLGLVQELTATLDRQSENVTWTLLSGDDAEDVVHNAKTRASGTFTSGRNRNHSPRVAAGSFALKIEGTGLWSFELAAIVGRFAGRQRQ